MYYNVVVIQCAISVLFTVLQKRSPTFHTNNSHKLEGNGTREANGNGANAALFFQGLAHFSFCTHLWIELQ